MTNGESFCELVYSLAFIHKSVLGNGNAFNLCPTYDCMLSNDILIITHNEYSTAFGCIETIKNYPSELEEMYRQFSTYMYRGHEITPAYFVNNTWSVCRVYQDTHAWVRSILKLFDKQSTTTMLVKTLLISDRMMKLYAIPYLDSVFVEVLDVDGSEYWIGLNARSYVMFCNGIKEPDKLSSMNRLLCEYFKSIEVT